MRKITAATAAFMVMPKLLWSSSFAKTVADVEVGNFALQCKLTPCRKKLSLFSIYTSMMKGVLVFFPVSLVF